MDIRETSIDHTDFSGRRTFAALYTDCERADEAVRDLAKAGFDKDQIGIVKRHRDADGKMYEDGGSLAVDGLTEGAVAGTAFGGILGLLAGLGTLLIPGVGVVVVGGIIGSVLLGAGIGALSGGLLGSLVGLGIPESEASYFEKGVQGGGAIVVVNAQGREDDARSIFGKSGGLMGPLDIDEGIRLVDEARKRGDGPTML